MALVDDGQEVVREIINQAERPGSGFPPVEIAGIVLDAGAEAQFLDHFHIVGDPVFEPLGFERPAYFAEVFRLLA